MNNTELILGPAGCLAADTLLEYKRGKRNSSRVVIIEQFYRSFNNLETGCSKFKNQSLDSYLHSCDGKGKVFYNKVLSVIKSGEKECMKLITTKGEIILTPDHPVCREDYIFIPAADLAYGEKVMVKGDMFAVYSGGKKIKDRPRRKVVETMKFHPTAPEKMVNGYFYQRQTFARCVIEADMNSISVEEFIHSLKHNEQLSKTFCYLDRKMDVHHINEDSLDDRRENLLVLSHADHAKLHSKQDNLSQNFFELAEVIGHEPAGEQMTYDIQMESPYNNFSANGIFVHNTGKTTTLLNIIEDALQEGVPPQRIGCFSFSTKAAAELVDRALKRFPQYKRSDFPYFRTLHSLAFKELGLHKGDVMNNDHLNEFGEIVGGYDFKHQYNEDIERVPAGGGLGDRALDLYARAKCRRKPLEEFWRSQIDIDIDWQSMKDFAEELDKFKETHGLLLFSDFMDICNTELDIDLLILDEAQDFTAQQWNFAFRAGVKAKKIFIAGDDDQTIFEWAGADLGTMLTLPAKRRVLPLSYRLPQTHFDLACRILDRISNRYPKEWRPKDEQGMVDYVPSEDLVDLSSGSWLLMARHKWDLKRLEAVALSQGVSYELEHRKSINKPEVKAVVAFERIRAGKNITRVQAMLIAKFIPKWEPPETLSHQVFWHDMKFPFSQDQTWMDVMTLMGYELREYIRAMLRKGENLLAEPRVKIATIHMSKGGEADNVILIPDMSRKTMIHYLDNPDPELRVWYVGATRAKNNLHIVSPRSKNHFEGLF